MQDKDQNTILNTIAFVSDPFGRQEGRSRGAIEVGLLQYYHHHHKRKICFFGYNKTFSPSFLSQNEYHHILYPPINLFLPVLNFSIRQLLMSFRTVLCSIFVLCLLARLMSYFTFFEFCEASR